MVSGARFHQPGSPSDSKEFSHPVPCCWRETVYSAVVLKACYAGHHQHNLSQEVFHPAGMVCFCWKILNLATKVERVLNYCLVSSWKTQESASVELKTHWSEADSDLEFLSEAFGLFPLLWKNAPQLRVSDKQKSRRCDAKSCSVDT